jgi:hypothetical protein
VNEDQVCRLRFLSLKTFRIAEERPCSAATGRFGAERFGENKSNWQLEATLS